MPQLEHIDAIERRLWSAADTLRANSSYASNEYFLPVMGLVFLRHAFSRYLAVRDEITADLPTRGGKRRAPTPQDFSRKGAMLLRPGARFDRLVALPGGEDRAKAIIEAMESIEADYESLRGALPKDEYRELDNDVLGQLLRTLDPDALKRVTGDVFGRIYEYFLTWFADQKAHDGGEFFTPVSLVSLIAHVLDPEHGTVLDPACGSGGMFVQSARTVEEHGRNPTERLTFRGLEKNATTIRLARMNLAVHGLEGDIKQAITYYEDPHELLGRADYVMANPPFNVDEIDAGKVGTDPRLPFGLPGVNRKGKVGNGNYVWISYFYSYLNERGRAGFVMSSQASSAGGSEAGLRQRLVKTGDVDVMIAIRSNFFYTRTVPCELWFLDRAKPKKHRGKVLMIDARNVYRKVTRKICDFSPEQQRNLLAIVWLYRGEAARFLELVSGYLWDVVAESQACFGEENEDGDTHRPLPEFLEALAILFKVLTPCLKTLPKTGPDADVLAEWKKERRRFVGEVRRFESRVGKAGAEWERTPDTSAGLNGLVDRFAPLAEAGHALAEQADRPCKLAVRLIEICERQPLARSRSRPAGERAGTDVVPYERECDARSSGAWNPREITRARKAADAARRNAVERLRRVRYFWRQACWLTERFPGAKLRDVEGLVKLVDRTEIEANDWSLTPGRYVGVAPEEEDESFDFRTALREIHAELDDLNAEAAVLAAKIRKNFEELGM